MEEDITQQIEQKVDETLSKSMIHLNVVVWMVEKISRSQPISGEMILMVVNHIQLTKLFSIRLIPCTSSGQEMNSLLKSHHVFLIFELWIGSTDC
ncbi:hypothetical protein EWB00_002064 [Schistosoma japonicum]|uniref:Uncharacterized protein n=1 Tax=Schistosoma japonicum TaxID=6182 RepID=A0A4Z2DDM0_SCHJA|nr:hypothetical protein EWB00_002064 [Schistosoma japonicum]